MKKVIKNLAASFIIALTIVKKKTWWPGTRQDQYAWWDNFKVKVVTYTTELEITTTELDTVETDAAMWQHLYKVENLVNDFKGSLGTYKRNLLGGKIPADIGAPPTLSLPIAPATVNSAEIDRTFLFVKNLKSRDGYTETIGDAMKILGDDIAPFDPTEFTPVGKTKNTEDYIEVKYVKGKFINGVEVYCQRGSNPDYITLGRVNKNKYQDKRYNLVTGVPEIRKYKIKAFIGDVLIGNTSAPFSATWTSPAPPPLPPLEDMPPPAAPEPPVV